MSRRPRKHKPVTQCDRCETYKCTDQRKENCAYQEFVTIANEHPRYECEDYTPSYEERLAA